MDDGIWKRGWLLTAIPFRTICLFLFQSGSLSNSVVNLGGNLIMFLPLGFLLPIVAGHHGRFRGHSQAFIVVGMCLGFSMMIETGQLLMLVGSFDVDDIILNTLGGWFGYGLLALCRKRSLTSIIAHQKSFAHVQ